MSLEELTARMPVLVLADHPLGMKEARAEEFARAVRANGDVPRALEQVGSSRRLAEILTRARPADPIAVLLRLLPIVSETDVLARRVKASASYPLALLVSIAVAAFAIFTVSTPALATMTWMRSGVTDASFALDFALCLGPVLLMLVIAVLSSRGSKIPGLTSGTRILDRALVLETAAVLTEAQVPLSLAIAAASVWAKAPMRTAGEAIARGLDTGAVAASGAPLLGPEAAAILWASAARGVGATVLRALAGQALIEARLQLPRELRRTQTATLLLAGLALLTLMVGWYRAYLHAMLG